MSEFTHLPAVDTDPADRWRNLHEFLKGTNLSDLERLIVQRAETPESAWRDLDNYWSTGVHGVRELVEDCELK